MIGYQSSKPIFVESVSFKCCFSHAFMQNLLLATLQCCTAWGMRLFGLAKKQVFFQKSISFIFVNSRFVKHHLFLVSQQFLTIWSSPAITAGRFSSHKHIICERCAIIFCNSGITEGGQRDETFHLASYCKCKNRDPLSIYFGFSVLLVFSRLLLLCFMEHFSVINGFNVAIHIRAH